MITKADVLDRAAEWQLRADVVEKDYVLGWFLAGIALHPEVSDHWVFKGGTCLKKCYFETYRFSEDLDFSLLPTARYSIDDLKHLLEEVAQSVSELSGLEFPKDLIEVRERHNKQGQPTFEGRVSYGGPLGIPVAPRIRLDLTQHEPILAETDRRDIFHAFPDVLPSGARVQAYSIEELFAEKTRALFERTRPRDFYDVGFILENRRDALDLEVAHDLFHGKCKAKNLTAPNAATLAQIVRDSAELRSEWANMLAHQLPQLPPLDARLDEMPQLLGWLDAPSFVVTPTLQPVGGSVGETVIAPPGATYWGGGQKIEIARFAAANRLMIEFRYHGRTRVAEPYSLRRAQTGNLLLYAWERGETHIKAFKVAEIASLQTTDLSFTPRYRIDMTASGPLSIPAAYSRPRTSTRPSRSGPTYVYQCGYCQKEFLHSKRDATLRTHKTLYGTRCSGRRGYLLRIE